jgi:protein phosphatase 1 regulatory subunit 10
VKKRKLSDSAAASKAGPPVKRPAVVAQPARAVVKREPKVVVTSVKDAKSDSSFFSNKPKAKLPKFTKAAPAASKTSGGDIVMKSANNVAQPSSFDPFQDALRSMKRTASPKTEVRSGTPQADIKSPIPPTRMGSVKKRKSVTFAPDSQLEQIKWIEKAIYDDDLSIDVSFGLHAYSLKFVHSICRPCTACIPFVTWIGMKALRCTLTVSLKSRWIGRMPYVSKFQHFTISVCLREAVVDIPTTLAEKGDGSTEKVAQEEREKSALSAVYMFPSQIPDTPAEPPQPPPDDPDAECKAMMLGDEVDGLSNEQPASAANISELLASLPSQLPSLGFANPTMAASQALGTPDVSMLSNFLHAMQNQGNLGALMQQFPPQAADASGWDSQQQQQSMFQNGNGNAWETSDTGWGGALGKGRGGAHRGKRRSCNFFAQGR